MAAGAAEAWGAVISIEDARDPAPIIAATTGRNVDDDNLVIHHSAGCGADDAVVPVTERV
jgi:hypothetical protein